MPITPTSPARPPSTATKASPLKCATRTLRSPSAGATNTALATATVAQNVPNTLRSKKDLVRSIEQLNVKLKRMVDDVNMYEEELNLHIEGREQVMQSFKEKYNSGLKETYEEQTMLSASRRVLKEKMKTLKGLEREKAGTSGKIEALKTKTQELSRGHNHIMSKLDLEIVYTAISASGDMIYDGSIDGEDSVESKRSLLTQAINELRSRESLLEYERERRETIVQAALAHLSNCLLQKIVLTNLLREEIEGPLEEEILRVPALKLNELSDASRAELLRTCDAAHSHLEALCHEHDRACRRAEEHRVEEQRLQLERRLRGEPDRKDYEDMDRIVAACVVGRAEESRKSGKARKYRPVIGTQMRKVIPSHVEPRDLNQSELGGKLLKLVFGLSQQVGELQRLKAQVVTAQEMAVHEVALLMCCCRDLDRRGLADAYWSRRPPPIDLNGPNPANRVHSRFVDCGGGVKTMQLLLEDHAIYTNDGSAVVERLEDHTRDLLRNCLLAAEGAQAEISSPAKALSSAVRVLFEDCHLSDLTGEVCVHGVPRRQNALPQHNLEQLFDPLGAGTALTGIAKLAVLGYQTKYIKGLDLRDHLTQT